MFTTPCFIRHNTKELVGKIKDLGYRPYPGDNIPYDWCIVTEFVGENNDVPYAGIWNNPPDPRCYNPIDCGNNEDLFLAIAALRDDSDKYQWFVHNPSGRFMECTKDEFHCFAMLMDNGNFIGYEDRKDDFHKATVEELIEHFKEE